MIRLIEWEEEAVTLDNIGKKIRKLRLRRDISTFRLAIEADISQAAVIAIENGNNPSMRTVTNLLDALGYEMVIRERR